MALLPKVKLKAVVSFPASVLDGMGIDVTKQNGSFQFNLAYDDFAPPASSIVDPPHQTVLLWNTITQVYALVPVSLMSGSGGVPEAPNDGVQYGRQSLGWTPITGGGSAGANQALSNLASVAINTTLLPGVTNSIALGSSTKTWNGAFFGPGASISWNAGAVFLTEQSGSLVYATSVDGAAFTLQNFNAGVNGATVVMEAASASPAASDLVGTIVFRGRDSGGAVQDYGAIGHSIINPTAGNETSALSLSITDAGASNGVNLSFGAFWPTITDKLALGSSSNRWTSLFLSSAASIKLGSADVTPRERLTSARTYFVRTDGNDANNGLANTTGGAFLTVQKALDTVGALDCGTSNVTIQIGNGTYSSANSVALLPRILGTGTFTIQGDVATPSNVVFVGGGAATIRGSNCGPWSVQGIKITNTGGNNGIEIFGASLLQLGTKMEFGSVGASAAAISAQAQAVCFLAGDFIISGNAAQFFYAASGAVIQSITGMTCTYIGTLTFSTFCVCDSGAIAVAGFITWTASGGATITGKRYAVSNGAIISVGGNVNYFPGTTPGTGTNPSVAPWGLYS